MHTQLGEGAVVSSGARALINPRARAQKPNNRHASSPPPSRSGPRRAGRREVAVRGRRVAVRGLAAAALALVRVRAEAADLAPVLVVDQGAAVSGIAEAKARSTTRKKVAFVSMLSDPARCMGPTRSTLGSSAMRWRPPCARRPRAHELDVEDAREVDVEQLEELLLRRRQRGARQDLQQIPEVVARVERDPFHFVD